MVHRTAARWLLTGALLTGAALALFAAGCGSGASSHDAVHDASDPIAVAALAAGASGSLDGMILPGRVRAREEVTLAARIAGRLTALPLREGAPFRRGQVLARFDAPETRDALRSAREQLASARGALEQARNDEARMKSLFERSVASQRDLELVEVQRQAAEAAHASAEAHLASWLENAALTAPFDGIVARRHVDPGQSLVPGQPILDLRSRSVGEIEVAVPESALPRLAGAETAFQIGDGAWQPARIARIDGMTDPSTRTRLAHLEPAESAALEPGAYARVRIRGGTLSTSGEGADSASVTLIVPSRALVRRGALTGVYVIREDRAWLRWLKVGRESEGHVEVLAGLSTGDRYAADPAGLTDGRAVTVSE
jgi:RND family efflux transporter MFP subunit